MSAIFNAISITISLIAYPACTINASYLVLAKKGGLGRRLNITLGGPSAGKGFKFLISYPTTTHPHYSIQFGILFFPFSPVNKVEI